MRKKLLATSIAVCLAAPVCAAAQDQTNTEQSRTEIEELRQRIQELENRLDQQSEIDAAQTAAPDTAVPEPAPATVAPEPAPVPVPEPASTGLASSVNAFNPGISLILNANYRDLQQDPDTYQIGGFVPSGGHGGEDGHGHGAGPGARGFSLDESELTITGNIDPYWLGFFTVGLLDEEVEIEEAWIQNSGYIPGVIAKAGRFFSGFGYINQQHPHSWDFVDAPLVQQAFYGPNLSEDGVQLRYVAPTPLFLEFGAEIGRGANFPGSERNKNGPNAGTFFVHLGGDVGFSNSYQAGASYRETTATEREYDDVDSGGNDIENVFSDLKSKTWGIDFVWKWAPEGDPTVTNAKFQAEYYRRTEDGQMGYDLDDMTGTFAQEGAYSSDQSGWYAQGVYQFMPRWRVGLRYDLLDSGTVEYAPITNGSISRDDLQLLREHKPERTTVMVDFSSSEFARFRLQYAHDKARFDLTDDQIIFQYIVSLGAHGAHRF